VPAAPQVSLLCSLLVLLLLKAKRQHYLLLRKMLPKKVIDKLHSQGGMFVESFTNVTILFSDICSYTTLAATVEPKEVVTMLNHVYRWGAGGGRPWLLGCLIADSRHRAHLVLQHLPVYGMSQSADVVAGPRGTGGRVLVLARGTVLRPRCCRAMLWLEAGCSRRSRRVGGQDVQCMALLQHRLTCPVSCRVLHLWHLHMPTPKPRLLPQHL
jgi:hypothetical protein